MILGIGTDLCNIERVERTLGRFGDRFRHRVYTGRELATAARRAEAGLEAATLAKRWAAKEACSKALGTGLRMGIAWRDMAVSNLATGQPVMAVGAAGGRRIVNAVLRVVAGVAGEGLSVADAVAAPRLHAEGDLAVVADAKHPAAEALRSAGYAVTGGAVGALTALGRDPGTGALTPSAR